MLISLSARIKDKRVDKIAIKQGYKDYEVFYSPLSIWLFFTFYILMLSLSLALAFLEYWCYWPGYLVPGYLISAYRNNSFILTEDELVVINPNFPFRNLRCYKIECIQKVKIDKNKWFYFLIMFIEFENNYVQINSEGKRKTYYCNGLNIDAYDENFTGKTLDDFSHSLTKKNIQVDFNFD
ncbi:MAG: hypothetical protein J7604_07065 [Sporocytophaga sp.]|uniref:hypothetical protein n=1 Tax=Sporocytophaga sp. TaxID=2231183 RepID=UPI001B024B6F|nr:hypothetical protein [Sporocytophaga sp.]MBO9699953.1 hypothetical protein [Sporocytophaga sp.]